ncbi:MAG: glycosyltransferase [Desulfomonilaceae bacterium]
MSRQHRLVWTLHDPWLTSGHCVHSLDCNKWLIGCKKCDQKDLWFPIKRNTTAFSWRLKHAVMHASKIDLVVASRWMLERVKRSPIVSHLPCHLIPFGVSGSFRPQDKASCRAQIGIPVDATVLGFRARPVEDYHKGLVHVEKALAALRFKKPIYLITFEQTGWNRFPIDRYNLIELGWVDDQDLISVALNAMDVFLMPSTAEAFGMMAVESMACGTPVICFEGTSLPQVIHAPQGGIAVPYKNDTALAEAIQTLLDNDSLRESLSANGLKIVGEEYREDLYVKRHLELYESLLAQGT